MTERIFAMLLLVLVAFTGTSCREDIGDCPDKLCMLAGGWKLEEVLLDGTKYTEDYSTYQLILSNPSANGETTADFQRVNIGGTQETGTWSLENSNLQAGTSFKGSVLRLIPGGNVQIQEDWEIESFTPRQMILVLHRDGSVKDGPSTIRFVLVPY